MNDKLDDVFTEVRSSDDVTEVTPEVVGKDLLTDFQQDKFKYFFYHVLDLNSDHVISEEDFRRLNQEIQIKINISAIKIKHGCKQLSTKRTLNTPNLISSA